MGARPRKKPRCVVHRWRANLGDVDPWGWVALRCLDCGATGESHAEHGMVLER